MDLPKVHSVGRQSTTEDRAVTISLSISFWNLLNFCSSSYLAQIGIDVIHNLSTKYGIGTNMLGGKAAPVSFTLIPAHPESELLETEAHNAMSRTLRFPPSPMTRQALSRHDMRFSVVSFGRGDIRSAACCQCVADLLSESIVKCTLACPHYQDKLEQPFSRGLSDRMWPFQDCTMTVLGTQPELDAPYRRRPPPPPTTTVRTASNSTKRKRTPSFTRGCARCWPLLAQALFSLVRRHEGRRN